MGKTSNEIWNLVNVECLKRDWLRSERPWNEHKCNRRFASPKIVVILFL
jgi:hypothetical protein